MNENEVSVFSEDSFAAIKSVGLLSSKDTTDLGELIPELQETFERAPLWRNETLARVSVLNDIKHTTPAAKYWQCINEQNVFYGNLISLSFEFKRNELKIKRLERKLVSLRGSDASDELDIEEVIIDIDECKVKRQHMEREGQHRVRELKMWSKLKKELVESSDFDQEDNETDQLISTTVQSLNRLFAATMPGCQLGPDEAKNIIGLCKTSLKRCQELKVMKKATGYLSDQVLERIMPMLGYSVKVEEGAEN